MVTNVRGEFKEYKESVYTKGDDFTSAEIDISIASESITTVDTNGDTHLKGLDFFDAENFKEIHFNSNSFDRIVGSDMF